MYGLKEMKSGGGDGGVALDWSWAPIAPQLDAGGGVGMERVVQRGDRYGCGSEEVIDRQA
ncbi:hypothetical protein GOP47_0014639 [Adiantum capillus-veneris]|uniref:Uncharacterized protein n=1 Tax=Adiantum capillus-veneris TaxID=13818 RepID=A0A9D4ULZ7_ADICA|nr:hypothetical protein GOP47_0014639 [Adiantum capillus-veneris]